MNDFKVKIVLAVVCLLSLNSICAQDSLLHQLSVKNVKTFEPNGNGFKGEGWDEIKERLSQSQNVLIGEDHFTNEIPAFVQAIANTTKFDNFYIEVDPYSTKIIKESIQNFSEKELKKFNDEYGELFVFYALEPEYKLLKNLVKSGVNLLGSDQVVMYDDRLIFNDLLGKTKNAAAMEIYKKVIQESELHLNKFYENPQNPMYFMTPDFGEQLTKLKALEISEIEQKIIADMMISVEIYQTQSHKKRVQLIMRQLMADYPLWSKSKNLFKYGAMHMSRGESFLTVYDIGNMIANITESQEKESLHMMVLAESGDMGSPFKIFPPTPIDIESESLKHFKPFFNITEGNQWHVFNLIPLRKAVEQGQLKVDNINLLRAIKGYDALVVIPKVTAAKF